MSDPDSASTSGSGRAWQWLQHKSKYLAFGFRDLRLWVAIVSALGTLELSADDNMIAQRLFQQGRFAEAAELYTDPAWRGVALYRSSQWWRAAEAFVRADDASSFFNLGNTYVKLGYYALALEAYQGALVREPEFADAHFNIALMRKLLEQGKDDNTQAGLSPKAEEIDRVDSDGEEAGDGSEEQGEGAEEEKQEGTDREGDTDSRGPSPNAIAAGDSAEAGSEETLEEEGTPEGGSVKGTEGQTDEENNPSGGSEGRERVSEAQAAGIRSELEVAQATEQWLNQIAHDPLKFLQRRIEFETARRRSVGDAAPEGGSQW